MATLKVGSVALPEPAQLSSGDEIIWSASTGRTASGKMTGDVVAEKKNLNITWGVLPESEVYKIKSNLKSGFLPLTFHDDGMNITISAYRGTLTKEHIGRLGDGIYYYKSVTVTIVEQ